MAYYLGRDIKVMLCTESTENGIQLDSSNNIAVATADNRQLTHFANQLDATSAGTAYALSDLTGVELSIGVVDEDITYVDNGANSKSVPFFSFCPSIVQPAMLPLLALNVPLTIKLEPTLSHFIPPSAK